MAGGAVAEAARILAERLRSIAAHLLQCDIDTVDLRQGMFYGPAGNISVPEAVRTWYMRPEQLSGELSVSGLEVLGLYRPKVDTGQYSYGTHAAVVSIDRMTGALRILDYVIVEDCGRRVNPLIVAGQTYGGAAQGIGTALLEEMQFDANGQPLASTLADYLIPGAAEMPNIRLHHIESPSPNTTYGIKGVGEGGAIPPPAAIFNAVNDAFSGTGVEINTTPLTPRRLYGAIERWDLARRGARA
jgi:carbon-monoxide dehydrogenase large subunit